MSEADARMIACLRTEFAAEAAAGFPLLRRSPHTLVIQFLDYYESLPAGEQAELLEALAIRGESLFAFGRDRVMPQPAAFDRYWRATHSPGPFTGGPRYCDVNTIATIPKLFGGMEGWIAATTTGSLAATPRSDLLPDLASVVPAKAAALRKELTAILLARGYQPQAAKSGARSGGDERFTHPSSAVLHLDFHARFMGQLVYGVSHAAGDIVLSRMSLESLWSQPGGWNYLTSENAARCLAALPDFVEHLMALAARLKAGNA